jgi:hypothetical protein
MGIESHPSEAIIHHHVKWNQDHRFTALLHANMLYEQYELLAVNVTECFAWLGWLISGETVGITIGDYTVVTPDNSDLYDLPRLSDAIFLYLLASTKSIQIKRDDLVLAFESAGGICLGKQFQGLQLVMYKLG